MCIRAAIPWDPAESVAEVCGFYIHTGRIFQSDMKHMRAFLLTFLQLLLRIRNQAMLKQTRLLLYTNIPQRWRVRNPNNKNTSLLLSFPCERPGKYIYIPSFFFIQSSRSQGDTQCTVLDCMWRLMKISIGFRFRGVFLVLPLFRTPLLRAISGWERVSELLTVDRQLSAGRVTWC